MPGTGAILDSLGWVYLKRGRLETANRFLRQAVRLAPWDAEIYSHLAEALVMAGRIETAIDHLHRAIELAEDEKARNTYLDRLTALARPEG